MKNIKIKLRYLCLAVVFAVMSTVLPPLAKRLLAVDDSIVRVNGVLILDGGVYNSSHGISGVGYNTDQNYLTLTSVSLESIYSNQDLTISITNNNAIDAVTSNIAVEVRGDLTIIGSNGSTLNIAALSADDRAIEIASGARLTIGDETDDANLITVNIQRGRNANTEDTYIVDGNTYNYDDGLPMGGGPGPAESDPMTISIGGEVVIDETADPQITSAEGEGWTIEGFEAGPSYVYGLNIDQGVTIDYITGTGDGMLTINGDANIAENEDGFSINMDGRINIFGGEGEDVGDVNLIGGLYTEGMLSTYDRAFTIGSAEAPSTKGVFASDIEVNRGKLTIYTTGTALQYYNETPSAGEGLFISSVAGEELVVASSSTVTANVVSVRVSGGGSVDFSYTDSLGSFIPKASHWPWTDMTGTEEENPLETTVNCEEGEDTVNKYKMTTSEGNFLLESTAGTLYQLGWNIPGADDSIVSNGTVRVIAANGYRFTSGGYTDYSIEAGSPVTIELLPDYGYQYVSGGLNGNQTQPEEGKASYSFIMPSNHLHLSAIFEPMSDIISINDEKIEGANISLPAGVINGNAELEINEVDEEIDESAFETKAGGKTIAGYIDLGLNEVIYKGSNDEAWVTPVEELEEPMTVELELDESLQGYTDYSILREHDGAVTELPAEYDEKTGQLVFETDGFSNYAIIHAEEIANPNTYDGIAKHFVVLGVGVFGLIISIVYLVASRRKKNI